MRGLVKASAASHTFAGLTSAKTAIDRNMVLIAKERDCQIDWRCRAILARFGLAEFDRPRDAVGDARSAAQSA